MKRSYCGIRTAFLGALALAGPIGCGGEEAPVPAPPTVQEQETHDAVVVYRFENAIGEEGYALWDAWMVDMVVRGLWQAEGLHVWSPQRAADLRERLGQVGRQDIVAAAREAGAATVILGRLARDPGGIVVEADVIEARDGSVRGSVRTVAEGLADVPAAADRLRDQLWETLKVSRPGDVRGITAMMTTDLMAYGRFVAGQTLYFQGKFLASVPHFAEASNADREFAVAHYRHATAIMQYVPAGTNEVKSHLTLAFGKRDHATVRDQLVIQGLRALLFEERDAAERLLMEARAGWPGDKEVAYFHGLALGQIGRNAEAADAFEAAARFDPEFLQAWEGLTNTAFLVGQGERAARAVEGGLAVNPAAPRLVAAQIDLALFAADLDAARQYVEDGLRHRQGRDLLLMRAKLTLLEGDAGSALEQAVAVRSPLLAAMAEIYAGSVRAGIARLATMSDLQAASSNRASAAVGKWITGMVLHSNGDTASAVQQFTDAANLRVDLLDSREALGVIYAGRGELESAETIAGGIRELGPKLTRAEHGWERHALRVEGAVALAREDFDQAIGLFREAYELSGIRFLGGGFVSDRPLYAETLAQAYRQKGDLREAQALFTEVTEMEGERLFWPWIWLGAHVELAELATRDNRPEDAAPAAARVRQFWAAAAGQNQSLVDGYLERLDRIVPATP